jgi:hypothetical protein
MISDLKMPGRSGLEFLDMLTDRGCKVRHMGVISGYWTADALEHASDRGYRVFRKPSGIWEIEHWLRGLLPAMDDYPSLAEYFREGPPTCCPETADTSD